jgi:galactose mutarotase-like enzyme
LEIELIAVADELTLVNLTTHPYFNLADDQRDIYEHFLSVDAPSYLPCAADRLPLREPADVTDTAFDLRRRGHAHEAPRHLSRAAELARSNQRSLGFTGYAPAWGSLATQDPLRIFHAGVTPRRTKKRKAGTKSHNCPCSTIL